MDNEPPVHPLLQRLAAYGWRLLVLAAVALGILWLLRELWVIVLALVVALFLTRALDPPARWLRAKGLPPALAALAVLAGLFGTLTLAGWLIIPSVTDEFDSLGPTLSDAVDDVERWLVEDSPFDIGRAELEDLRRDAGDAISSTLRSSSGSIVSGALVALEAVAGLLLAVITTFFFVKDGPRIQSWALTKMPAPRRELTRRLGARAWETLGGYLRGAVLLGAVEGAIIGITLAVVGANLVLPVAVLTFAAAFVPIVGAIVAGVVAVLVTLATTGAAEALVVAVVAIVVQQLDNDLLAPVIYGRALQLHPLVILFAVVAGGALFGFAGSVLGVPFTAVVVNLTAEARLGQATGERTEP